MRYRTALAIFLAVVLWPSSALANGVSLETVGAINQHRSFAVHFRGPQGPHGPPIGRCLIPNTSKVEFRWDDIFLHSGEPSAYCMVTFETKVPVAKNVPGTHTITAIYQTNDGVKHSITKTVTVQGIVQPTPKPKPSPKQTSEPVPKPSASSPAPASPSPSASEVAPSPSDSPTVAASLVRKASDNGVGGIGWLPFGIGGALVLVGGGLLFWLIRRGRPGEGSEAPE